MSYETKYENWEEKVKEASENTLTASAAAAYLGIKYDTYKKYAIKYGCFKTNQPGKGLTRSTCFKIPIKEILEGKHPGFSTSHLNKRIKNEGILPYICSECGLEDIWNSKSITLHLDHINGINKDHRLENLRYLCPNCHSQTDTWCGRNNKLNSIGGM